MSELALGDLFKRMHTAAKHIQDTSADVNMDLHGRELARCFLEMHERASMYWIARETRLKGSPSPTEYDVLLYVLRAARALYHGSSMSGASTKAMRAFERTGKTVVSVHHYAALRTALQAWTDLHPAAIQPTYDEYNPWLKGDAARAARNDPNKPKNACCNNEHRGWNGGCGNCGAPCL